MSRTMPIRRPCVALVIAALLPAALPASAIATHRRARTPASSYPAENSRPRAPSARAHAASKRKVSRRRRVKPRGPVVHGDALRAYLAFEAMQRDYYIQGSGLYAGEPFSYLWPFSQALASTVSLAHVPALARTLRRELSARLAGLQ